ncbi:MAG: KH domain-containing protein [Candidatus Aenigmarchaeota archaeon]|nr:KH domain-containing protein [Candidatus Aenigmarchaeota archaeon]
MKEFIKIPQERIPVLIGTEGTVKKELEKRTRTKITITDEIEIEGETFDVMLAANVVKAISRGFSPENAFLLLDEEHELNVITLSGQSERTVKRLMGRVIGRQGRTRRKIEEMCGAKISIYGKTVAIIARTAELETASRCMEMLLKGRTHGYVYHFLEDMKNKR